ncbi:hypothetical protein NP493_1408g00026 [Ridgeia piscesae]|uniref:Uncharacterized protein n=1 Tax=Ridgeia piscesae TaxID=27915 RepID=A0AAD9K4A7_RIDPI|nr:hypothetical protein NP493_1408g00026 [Ridgeia piscesae]
MWGQHGHKNVRGLDKNGCHAGFDHVPMVPSPERNVALHSPKTVMISGVLVVTNDSWMLYLCFVRYNEFCFVFAISRGRQTIPKDHGPVYYVFKPGRFLPIPSNRTYTMSPPQPYPRETSLHRPPTRHPG